MFICLFLAVFLLIAKPERRLTNRCFAAFLILTAIDVSGWFWSGGDISRSWLSGLRVSIGFLQMPIFLGFIIASCYVDFKLKLQHMFHSIPVFLSMWLLLPNKQQSFLPSQLQESSVVNAIIYWGSQIQYYLYMIIVVFTLWHFKSLFHRYHSGGKSFVLQWLFQLVAISLFVHSLVVIRMGVAYGEYFALFKNLQVLGALTVLGVVTWITLKLLLVPELFRAVDRNLLRAVQVETIDEPKTDEPSHLMERLTEHMEKQEPFLDPDLSLPILAGQLQIAPRDISETINHEIGVHFFDFINGYRVLKAQNILTTQPDLSVLQILYQVGFNSKSSFNTAFKKYTGQTPSAFRKNSMK